MTETDAFSIGLDDDGIICITLRPRRAVSRQDLERLYTEASEYREIRPNLVICDSRGGSRVSRGAREFGSSEAFSYVTAVALLVASPLSRVVGNFFIALNKPPFAAKLFTDEAKARSWLQTFKGDAEAAAAR